MTSPTPRPPLLFRIERLIGRLFGQYWVGEYERAVIYTDERYNRLEGPGFFAIDPFTERIHAIINVAPDMFRTTFSGIQTHDRLPVDLSVGLNFGFAPERMQREIAQLVVQWTPEERRGALTLHAQNALQKVLSQFTIDQVCSGQAFEEIEHRTLRALSELVSRLGLEPMQALLLQVTPPAKVRDRFADIAQRRSNAFDLAQYTPYELDRVMRAQMIEALSRTSPNRQYVEIPVGPTDIAPNPPPVIDAPPSHSSVQSDAEETQDTGAPPPRKRPRSRFDDSP